MKNLTLTNLRNAETLEAITLLNYYSNQFNKVDDPNNSALTLFSQTKSVLELLGLYSDLTITRSIEIYTSLSAEDIDAFKLSYGYSFRFSYYFIDNMVDRFNSKEIGIVEIAGLSYAVSI